MIRWLLGRPDRVVEWVNSSLLNSMILGKLWMLAAYLILCTGYFNNLVISKYHVGSLVLAALFTHVLLWWQVLRGGWVLLRDADASSTWLVVGAVLWLKALLIFQLLCLLCWYSISAPPADSRPWLQF
jgi:hypothetical protein